MEIDESKIGKRKYHRGHFVEGQWVFGGCEKNNSKKAFCVPVACRTKAVLLPLIQRWILPGSIILSGMFFMFFQMMQFVIIKTVHT